MRASPKRNWRGTVRVIIVYAVLSCLASYTASCADLGQQAVRPTPADGVAATPSTVVPRRPDLLIYGTNMALYDAQDQFVNNRATQDLFRQYHIPIVRMPLRLGFPDANAIRALQAIKDVGALPLVIVHGPADPNVLDDDMHLIALVQRVFGDSSVYVEYGNEPDLADIDVWRYISSWNDVVPHLKAAAPTYKFIGPVNYQSDPTYIATFDKYASPRPDLNSWHEYACRAGEPDSFCLTQTASWTQHIRATNDAVQSSIGVTLPIMITEWNLDAYEDARYANASFMQTWMTAALRTLAANRSSGLVGAMQYCATNNAVHEMVDSANTFTPEGQVFFQLLALDAGQG